jgi:hypothetical protein
VLTAGVGGVLRTGEGCERETGFVVCVVRVDSRRPGTHEVRLDDESQTTAHDTVAVLASQRCLHARNAFVWYALHQTHVEVNLVPFDDSALNLEERQPDARLCAARGGGDV